MEPLEATERIEPLDATESIDPAEPRHPIENADIAEKAEVTLATLRYDSTEAMERRECQFSNMSAP